MTHPDPATQPQIVPDPEAAPCPRCGMIDRPTLTAGTGPHACKASCAHCGRFIKWISPRAPAERHAHQREAIRMAMAQKAPSLAQLAYLQALGDTQPSPVSMAEASERIEVLKAATEATCSNAPGRTP